MSAEQADTIERMNKYADALHILIDTVPDNKKGPLVAEWKQVVDWITSQNRYGKFN